MSIYGLKIKNYQAGSIYEVMIGTRNEYDTKDAMFTNSLFSDFIKENGLNVFKEESTRDIICVEFNYGSRSFEEEIEHIKKIGKQNRLEYKIAKSLKYIDKSRYEKAKHKKHNINHLFLNAQLNKIKFDKKSKEELREIFYQEGIEIRYPIFDKNKRIKDYSTIQYKMLYRTPGKAKKGSCMFIKKSLYKKAHDFLTMGIKLPKNNAPIVEIGAYSSLATSTIEGKIFIKPENILILKDVDSFFNSNIISIELDENKCCIAVPKENYRVKNTLFDGQALIDSSIFPEWADGYILLRHHFTKCAAFCSNIQTYFKDYYGESYETAKVVDMWGNEHYVKDIKMITTDNAIKWIKFNISYDYWCEWVHKNNCMFGIVKTAHKSKLGNVQRMSYQMINALDENIMESVLQYSKNYIMELKKNDNEFINYLKKNSNFSNDFDVLVALCEHNPEFTRCDYFRNRKKKIINDYVNNLKKGKVLQNADNLVIVGNPYAMLMHSVGENPLSDPTFICEEGTTQCWTARFDDGEYLAEFRSPFNSQNNMGYLHNHYHPYFDKYFNLGQQIIAVNMIGTDFQDKNNGSDMDSDSIYTTNQPEIVAHAKYCCKNYPTIVNNIPKDSNHYNNTLLDYAKIDNNLAAAQLAIGESSNLAQICLSYSHTFENKKYKDYVCILSVLAQCAIDNAKRSFDVDIPEEIKRIKKDIDIKTIKYPAFWLSIRKDFNKNNINKDLKCPMNYIYNLKLDSYNPKTSTIPFSDFFTVYKLENNKKMAKKIQALIENYSFNLANYHMDDDDNDEQFLLLRSDFEDLIRDIRLLNISNNSLPLISWLISRAFKVTEQSRNSETKLDKNKAILLKILYELNPKILLKCFKKETQL